MEQISKHILLQLPSHKRKKTSHLLCSMPSPIIPRSKSVPDIASPHSPSDVLASTKSVRTVKSTGSPIISWPKKLGGLIKGNPNSNLTVAGLQEFNRRNALIEERYVTSSPYYKGLTNFSLAINKERLAGLSPGRESHDVSYVSSGSKASFIAKMKEWSSSLFTPKKHERSYSSFSSSWTKTSNESRFMASSSLSSKITENEVAVTKRGARRSKNESESDMKGANPHSIRSDNTFKSTMEKPLREGVSEPSVLLPQPPIKPPPGPSPYPLQQTIPSTGQVSPPPTPLYNESSTPSPPQALHTSPPPALQAPQPQLLAAGGVADGKREMKTKENESEYVWADNYRPVWLEEFLCNKSKAQWLQSMARGWHDKARECGHFIFEGNPGVGKRTMIWALLREIFGEANVQAREESRKFHFKGEAVESILVNLTVSSKHVEVNLSELRGYEKHIIAELVKAETMPITTSSAKEEKCGVVVLYEADKQSTDALTYIKWMLEKHEVCNKVFFCCSDAKKLQVIDPICTYVQLLEPSVEEILDVLAKIAREEKIQLPGQLATKIANNSKNNLRQAIRSFEATWHFSALLKEDQIIKTGWEDKIANIAKNVVEEQSPMQLYYIRGEIKNLIEHNVAPEYIFETLKEELQKILPDHLQMQFLQLYEEYKKNNSMKYLLSGELEVGLSERQHDQKKNVQKFMKIEEFIARFMSWYKGFAIKNMEV